MNDLVKATNNLPGLWGGMADENDDLSSGVSGGFSVISFRGAKWRIKHDGDEELLKNSDGDAMPTIRVVMLKANKHISKNYYAGAYVEGSTDSPTCWSVDGIKPDSAVPEPVSAVCASCPYNQFGSRITESGSKAKACSDSRRVAVVPEGDLANEQFGGPMLLRVPAASLSELAAFGKGMKAKGYPYNTIVTKLAFDPDTAYPRLKFQAVRPITDDERAQLTELLSDDSFRQKIEFVLATAVEVQPEAEAKPEPVAKSALDFEEAAAAEQPKPVVTPVRAKPVAVETEAPKAPSKPRAVPRAAKPEPKPEPEKQAPTAAGALDDELEDILAKLDSLE